LVEADNDFPIANAGADTNLDCDFTPITIGGTSSQGPTISYQWTTISGGVISNPNSLNPTINLPGVYQLAVTDSGNGCTAIDEITILENDNLPAELVYDLTPISCEGENDGSLTITSVLGGTPPYTYSFNGQPSSNINTYPFLEAGDYSVVVEDAEGCELTTEVSLIDPTPFIIDLGPDIVIELGDETQLDVQSSMIYDSLSWRFEETLPCDNCPNPIVAPFQTTTYQATAINFNGCEDTDDITIFVEKPRNVFIPNVFTPNDDGINDIFLIHGGSDVQKIHVFKIFTRWGEEVYEQKDFLPNDNAFGWDGFFRGKKMNPAVFVYFAEIEFIDGVKIIYKGDVALRR